MRFGRGRRTLGIDIGSARIKAALIDHSGAVPQLLRLASAPVTLDSIVDGEVLQPDDVAGTLRQVVEAIDVRSRAVVTGLGGREVIVKKVTIDRMSESDAREVISWDAERYIPFDLEDVHLDLHLTDPGGDGAEMDVLIVAARKSAVEERSALLARAGLTVSVVDVDAFALSNALEAAYPEISDGRVVLVNIGYDTTRIVVREGGVPLPLRDVAFGTRHIVEDLAAHFDLESGDVAKVLEADGVVAPEIDGCLRDHANELSTAVERATSFLSEPTSPRVPYASVYLSGGGSRVPHVQEAIARRLRARTEVADPLRGLAMNPDVASAIPAYGAAMWMTAVGLAGRYPF